MNLKKTACILMLIVFAAGFSGNYQPAYTQYQFQNEKELKRLEKERKKAEKERKKAEKEHRKILKMQKEREKLSEQLSADKVLKIGRAHV